MVEKGVYDIYKKKRPLRCQFSKFMDLWSVKSVICARSSKKKKKKMSTWH
jgi:hypothetical protein